MSLQSVLEKGISCQLFIAMLSIFDGDRPLSRRKLLQIGSLGAAGLALPDLLRAKEQGYRTGKSVIFLFQQGGPSQHETFDPKLDIPAEYRTVTGTIPTAVPGIHFGDQLPCLAKLADKFSIVRSYQTKNAGHNIRPLVGPVSKDASVGAHFSRMAGAMNPATSLPTNMVLFPQAVDSEVTPGKARGNLASVGEHSSQFAPFIPGAGGQLQKDLQLAMPRDRFLNDRRSLLEKLDSLSRQMENDPGVGAMNQLEAQATNVLLGGGVMRALDLENEDPKTLARYDTSGYASMDHWQSVNRGRRGFYHGHAATLGKLLLQARRLCEAGCGFVTVHASYDGVWDMHADGNNLNMRDGMAAVGPAFDHALSALIEDIEARGLSDDILVVASGEMGRNPKINKKGGRDHWSRLAPLLLYGGGFQGGQVIGGSDKLGGEPATEPFTPDHLIATILRTLLNPQQLRLDPDVPDSINQLINHDPIDGFG